MLKPGGKLVCAVPFLQPLHGYPHHYYNMTGEGLRNLFAGHLAVDHQYVPASLLPIWSLTWMIQSWAAGLPPDVRKRFLSRRLSDFTADPLSLLQEPYVTQLSDQKNLELASGTYLFAHKEIGALRALIPPAGERAQASPRCLFDRSRHVSNPPRHSVAAKAEPGMTRECRNRGCMVDSRNPARRGHSGRPSGAILRGTDRRSHTPGLHAIPTSPTNQSASH